jgi:hypothetical protein
MGYARIADLSEFHESREQHLFSATGQPAAREIFCASYVSWRAFFFTCVVEKFGVWVSLSPTLVPRMQSILLHWLFIFCRLSYGTVLKYNLFNHIQTWKLIL